MATTPRTMHEPVPAPVVDDGSSRLLLTTARVAWDEAAILGLLSILLLLVLAPFVLLASTVGWLVVWAPMVLVSAPVWLATVIVADRLLDHRGVAVRALPRSIRQCARTAWLIGMAPAVAGALVLGLLELIERNAGGIGPRVGLPLALGVLVTVAVLVGPVFAAAARFDIGARAAWQVGARIVVARPLQHIGLVLCFALLLWLTVVVSPVVLLGLALLALLTAAVARVPNNELHRASDRGVER